MIFLINKKKVLGSSFLLLLSCVGFVHSFSFNSFVNSFKVFSPNKKTNSEQLREFINAFFQRTSGGRVIVERVREYGSEALLKKTVDDSLKVHFKEMQDFLNCIRGHFGLRDGIDKFAEMLKFYFEKDKMICEKKVQCFYEKTRMPDWCHNDCSFQYIQEGLSMLFQDKDKSDILSVFEQFNAFKQVSVLNFQSAPQIAPSAEPGLDKASPMAFVTKAPIASEYVSCEQEVNQEQPVIIDAKDLMVSQPKVEEAVVPQVSHFAYKVFWERCKAFCVQHKTALIGAAAVTVFVGVGYWIYKNTKKNDFKNQLHIRKRNLEKLERTMKNYKRH